MEKNMPISLKKGQKVSLTKDNPGLKKVVVGLGWDVNQYDTGGAFDLDAAAFLLTDSGRVSKSEDFVFYGNLKHPSGAVQHIGDNLTGAGEGDDEQIIVDLKQVPSEYDKIILVVNIYQAVQRKQHFGMIQNAYIRVVDGRNSTEMCKYNLTDDYSNMTAMIFGEVYRHNDEWKFNALGQGTTDPGLGELVNRFV